MRNWDQVIQRKGWIKLTKVIQGTEIVNSCKNRGVCSKDREKELFRIEQYKVNTKIRIVQGVSPDGWEEYCVKKFFLFLD